MSASPRTGKVYGFSYRRGDSLVEVFGRQRMAINDSDACVAAGVAGIGLIQMPEFTLRDDLAAGKLVPVLEDHPSKELPLCILYPQNRHLSSKVRAFVEWTAELFARPDIAGERQDAAQAKMTAT